MKLATRASLAALLIPLALGLIASTALAQEGYDLSWWTVDGGGHTFSAGGGYSLGGTIGQADAGVLSGTGYRLAGGFWSGGAAVYEIYLPLVLRGYP
ncbi:MAG: hypothetical protein JXM73_13390 [Anaerolineae bacterium]|nr:hypothetical protein [Anaerolineae bacterium]